MNEDIIIEEQDVQPIPKVTDAQLPINFLSLGEIEHDDVKIYIKQEVFKALEHYAQIDVEHERGTILVGNYIEAHGKIHVVISDYIEARYTDASASTLTFTHETWDYIHKEQDAKYPDKTIVGWQHTHPSYGIFLSNYDLFIHENFFNLPFQIAYVIDPVQRLRGFFQWKNGKIEKLQGYFIYDDIGKTIKIDQYKNKTQTINGVTKQTQHKFSQTIFPTVLALLLIILLISTISLFKKYSLLVQYQAQVESQITNQEDAISSIDDTLISIQEEMIQYQPQEVQNNERRDIQISQESNIDSDNSFDEAEISQPRLTCFQLYTVQEGDTLLSICERLGIDYNASLQIIRGVNGIENLDKIYTGQNILLPVQQ